MKLLVVSHACTVPLNRDVYELLEVDHGHRVTMVIPHMWPTDFDELEPESRFWGDRLQKLRIKNVGSIQRHRYSMRDVFKTLRHQRPDFVIVEQELYSLAGLQWAVALRTLRMRYAMQNAENLVGRVPMWWRPVVGLTGRGSRLVMARSHTAVQVARDWGVTSHVAFIPHALPGPLISAGARWARGDQDRPASAPSESFTIGFAGRIVAEKGVSALAAVIRNLDLPVPIRLLVAGQGPEIAPLNELRRDGFEVQIETFSHHRMSDFYEQIDVLLVPSVTTPQWTEQFGRVIVEAAAFGVAVVGSRSGEIPWVISDLDAGTSVPEADVAAWCSAVHAVFEQGSRRRKSRSDMAISKYSAVQVAIALNDAVSEVCA